MFFVVDFETSGRTPWDKWSIPLSVGIVPVNESGDIVQLEGYGEMYFQKVPGGNAQDDTWFFYERFKHNEVPRPDLVPESDLTGTYRWWLDIRDQYPGAYMDAWYDSVTRLAKLDLCHRMIEYLNRVEPNLELRFLAANPGSFDKMWMEYIFASEGLSVPFSHRTLCMRSMRFGLDSDTQEFGRTKGAHTSVLPHHALHDAMGESLELQSYINQKKKKNEVRTDIPAGIV